MIYKENKKNRKMFIAADLVSLKVKWNLPVDLDSYSLLIIKVNK